MKAWLLDDLNGIGNLRLADVPQPVPQAGEAVLRLAYAGLNPADRYLAERQYPARPALPHILGRDGLGTAVQLGPGTAGIRVGERRLLLRSDVGVTRPGTFAEFVAVPVESLAAIPEGWSDVQAGGAALAYLTAYMALTMWGPVPAGSVLLITGASGGVGSAAVHLGAAMGFTVIGLSRSAGKGERLRQEGAAATFNPADPGWRLQAKKFLGERRVDLAIDNIGGKLLPQVIDLLGEHGKVSLVGRLAGAVPEFNTASLFFRRLRLGGVAAGAWSPAEAQTAWRDVVRLLGRMRPLVDQVFPFDALPQAFERLEQGPLGKVLCAINT